MHQLPLISFLPFALLRVVDGFRLPTENLSLAPHLSVGLRGRCKWKKIKGSQHERKVWCIPERGMHIAS